ncbi:MAG: chorismate synthase [Candidatus Ornithospirochaeta sp.]|nr:chorismate synthase [Candidatus Ornithospirochaeta sp.]
MAGNTFGEAFRVTTFGESHGIALGVIVDGFPAGIEIDEGFIQSEMDRRRPGGTKLGTMRSESDRIRILSGIFEGRSTGCPIAMMLENSNQKSGDYSAIQHLFRPGHADYTFQEKYGIRDYRGGGRTSGRETSARVAAGALAKILLGRKGISINAGVTMVHGIWAEDALWNPPFKAPLYCVTCSNGDRMIEEIENAKRSLDSVGGIIECRIDGCPIGLGSPVFDKLDAMLAHAMLSIGAVKGIEFGSGFGASSLFGSQNNDQMEMRDGRPAFITNNAGGILGGLSNGNQIVFRIAVKPTPSIARKQHTVSDSFEDRDIEITGRHDPTILARAVVVVEAMAAITLLDALLRDGYVR